MEAVLESVFRAAPVGIGVMIHRVFQSVNEYLGVMTGYRAEELIGQSARILYPGDEEYERVGREKYAQIRQTGKGSIEAHWRRKDGSILEVLLTYTVIVPGHPELGVVFTALDITERKRDEQALIESERFARSTLDGLSAHIAIVEESGRILAVNKAWRGFAMANPPLASPVSEGANYLEVCDHATGDCAEEAARFAQGLRDVLAGRRESFELEYPCHSPGEKRWFIGRVTPFPGEGPRRAVIAHENITGRKLAEEELARREEHFRSLLQSLSEVILVVNPEGRITDANQNALRAFGRARQEVLGASLYENWAAEYFCLSQEEFRRRVREVFESGEPANFHSVRTRANGAEEHHDTLLSPLRDTLGHVTHVILADRDMSDLFEAQAKLHETRRKLATLLGNLPGMAYRCLNTPDWPMEFVSQGSQALCGLPPERLTGLDAISYAQLIHPEDLGLVWDTVQKALARREPFELEYRITDAHGNLKWVWERGVGIFSDEGKVEALEGFIADITRRKKAELALEKSEALLREMGEVARIGGWEFDPETGEGTWTPEVARLHETGTDFHPTVERGILFFAPEARPALQEALRAAIERGESFDLELPLITAKGNRRWAHLIGRVERQGGRVVRVYGAIQDVTARREAEEKLHDLEERLRAFLDNVDDMVYFQRLDSSHVMFNQANARITGYSLEEFARDPQLWRRLVHPEDRQTAEEFFSHMAGKVDRFEVEYRLRTRDGDWRWIHSKMVAARDAAGRITGYNCIDRDVTQRRQIQQQERERLERIQRQQAAILELALSPEVQKGEIPAAFQRLTELAAGVCGAERVSVWLKSSDGERLCLIDLFERGANRHSSGAVLTVAEHPEYFRALEEGRTIDAPEARADSRTAGFNAVYFDPLDIQSLLDSPVRLTDRIAGVVSFESVGRRRAWQPDEITFAGELADQAARALYNAERQQTERERMRLFTAIEQSRDMILLTNPEGVIEYANPALETLTGFTRAEAIGAPLDFSGAEENSAALLAEMKKRLRQGEPWAGRMERRRKDGETYVEDCFLSPIQGPSGALAGFVSYHRDVTEQARLEEKLRQTAKLESLGLLAGGIAHDFSNLLMGVVGNADLARSELPSTSPAHEYLHAIEKEAKRATELCRQLLAYSGRGRFVIEPLNLNALIEDMAHILQISISRKVILKYRFAKDLPATEGDATQIRQILMNLTLNASDAIGDRSGVISISTGVVECDAEYLTSACMETSPRPGTYVFFEVADTGCGMDEATRRKVFDPFFTTKFTGRGLGLAAVLGIVRGHKGAIKLYSEPGQGTTFKILLPACATPAVSKTPPPASHPPTPKGRGTILVVDDERTIRGVAQRMLERAGFRVLLAEDGRQAAEVFREHAGEIAAVLLDLTMPRMGGEEAYRELRRVRPDVRVLMMSGYNEFEIQARFAGKGLAGFLQKPFKSEELLAKLHDILGPGAPSREAPSSP